VNDQGNGDWERSNNLKVKNLEKSKGLKAGRNKTDMDQALGRSNQNWPVGVLGKTTLKAWG